LAQNPEEANSLSRKIETVRTLAASAGVDVDEALIYLWDAGLNSINDPKVRLSSRDLKKAREVLNLSSGHAEARISWWLERTGFSFDEFSRRAEMVGVFLSPSMRTLPKGALKRIRREFPTVQSTAEEDSEVEEEVEIAPLMWEQIGTFPPRVFLNADEVERFHWALVDEFSDSSDPISPPGLRSVSLLSSALTRPQTQYSDELKYQTVEMAGAALLHSLIHNHAFFNGNKRTAFLSLLVFLDLNRTFLNCSEDDQFQFLVRVGSHSLLPEIFDNTLSDREVLEIAKWIKKHTRPVEHGERPMTWFKLKQLLSGYGCSFTVRTGNRIEIRRQVARDGVFRKTSVLCSKASYPGDGTDVQRNALRKIRRELQLDEEHGIDSFAFYVGEPVNIFILKHRGLLTRLARV
jgi:death-on-curing family protein